mmetsp:Transcript_28308/g.28600  ORF Transcript_28308/g.28600 Transcript_28308/m.28600 type:complete len:331 (+) Transcript_28308:243-1235(+)
MSVPNQSFNKGIQQSQDSYNNVKSMHGMAMDVVGTCLSLSNSSVADSMKMNDKGVIPMSQVPSARITDTNSEREMDQIHYQEPQPPTHQQSNPNHMIGVNDSNTRKNLCIRSESYSLNNKNDLKFFSETTGKISEQQPEHSEDCTVSKSKRFDCPSQLDSMSDMCVGNCIRSTEGKGGCHSEPPSTSRPEVHSSDIDVLPSASSSTYMTQLIQPTGDRSKDMKSWHNISNDMTDRLTVLHHLICLLLRHLPSTVLQIPSFQKQITSLAKRLEYSLYCGASSLQEYRDMHSLSSRLEDLAIVTGAIKRRLSVQTDNETKNIHKKRYMQQLR